MATAYAAVISLIHVMEQIQQYHARYPIFRDKHQSQLRSIKNLVFLFQEFLEGYSHGGVKEMKGLENRIADAAHAAEDIIESQIVDHIHDRSKGHEKSSLTSDFSEGLLQVMADMDLIYKEVMEIQEKHGSKDQQHQDPAPLRSSAPPPSGKDTIMVLDEGSIYVMDKLTGGEPNLQVISITGMGGIGKTTLAKNIYHNLLIEQHFDIRGWITLSQQYDVRDILLCLLKEIKGCNGNRDEESCDEDQLKIKLYQFLSGRRYLIVMDDIWNTEAWDKFKIFLPDNGNGSRIMVTTRIWDVANNIGSSNLYQMKLLDEEKSWSLFCRKVFASENCPPELVKVGKRIAQNCKGLPLSIGVIGGLLANSKMSEEYWEYVAENMTSTIFSNDDSCLKVLSLSYDHLPIHLKPCFLYMGVFSEDREIRIKRLIRLWVAEGFLRPSKTKSLEEVARDYVEDLISRNLISISKLGCTGNVKYCKIHDLLRDLCLKEAQKERFLHFKWLYKPNASQGVRSHFEIGDDATELCGTTNLEGRNSQRRMAIHLKSNEINTLRGLCILPSTTSFLRSLLCDYELDFRHIVNFRLLRVFDVESIGYPEDILQLVNLRYLKLSNDLSLPPSIYMLWNLQTLIIEETYGATIVVPLEIWKMTQLRHLMVYPYFSLPDPPDSQIYKKRGFVLENLQTLLGVINFICTKEVLTNVPNVVKLKLAYTDKYLSLYCLNNVRHLTKLQSLCLHLPLRFDTPHGRNDLRQIHEFPLSLRKLTLRGLSFYWEDVTTTIGSLPHLEKLKLQFCNTGKEWNPVEGGFLNLKFLKIFVISDLVCWNADSCHFPRLEHLVLYSITNLKEIPSGIGDIPTLRSIRLNYCCDSLIDTAKKILEEQESSGNEGFRLLVNQFF